MTAVAGGGMTEQQRERRDSAAAADLLDHPGFKDVLKDVLLEAKAARGVLLTGEFTDETRYAYARGSLTVLKNIVLAVYRRANKEVPDNVKSLFE